MMDDLNRWILENLYFVPIAIVGLYLWVHYQQKRIDQRIDAVITLLKQRGIDILSDDD